MQRDRLRLILAVFLTFVSLFTLLVRHRLAPFAERLILTQVDNQASDAINAAIAEQVASGAVDYDRIVSVIKTGEVTTLRADTAEINRLKTDVLERVDARLSQLSVEELGVPLGSVVLPELLSSRGPKIPVRVLAVRTSDAEFRNDFSSAGINQTLHRIMIDIHVTVTVLTLGGTREIDVETSVAAAETVIVGEVPTTYFGMEDIS